MGPHGLFRQFGLDLRTCFGEFPAQVQLTPVLLALYDRVKLRGDFHPTPAVFLATRRSASVVEGNRLLFFEGLTADRLASRM